MPVIFLEMLVEHQEKRLSEGVLKYCRRSLIYGESFVMSSVGNIASKIYRTDSINEELKVLYSFNIGGRISVILAY